MTKNILSMFMSALQKSFSLDQGLKQEWKKIYVRHN